MSKCRTKLEKITPQKAIKWLKKYTAGKPIDKERLNYCNSKIRNVATPSEIPFIEAIAFDKSGNLLHGKTRLTACVRMGTEFSSYVMYNADKGILIQAGILPTYKGEDSEPQIEIKPNNHHHMTMTTTKTEIKQKVMLITPELAKQYLDKNTGNRPVKPDNVRFIAAQLRAGTWKMGPDAIAFDTNDRLINGQHRLLACIETGIPFQNNVMFGLEPDAFNVIDTGIKRSGGDALSTIEGMAQPKLKSAIIRSVIEFKKGKSTVAQSNSIKLKITNQMTVDFYNKNASKVDDAATIGQNVYSAPNRLFSSSTIGAFAYIFNEIDFDDSKLFFEMFRLGEGLQKGNPVLTLRNTLIADAGSSKKYTKRAKYAMVIDAWNAYRSGKKLNRFTIRNEGALPKPI